MYLFLSQGHEAVVRVLLECGANVEDHNENGHTPLMEAASAGHVGVAKILLEYGAGINTHSNEFKESALTLACYKGHLDMVRFLLSAGADQVSVDSCSIRYGFQTFFFFYYKYRLFCLEVLCETNIEVVY